MGCGGIRCGELLLNYPEINAKSGWYAKLSPKNPGAATSGPHVISLRSVISGESLQIRNEKEVGERNRRRASEGFPIGGKGEVERAPSLSPSLHTL